MRFDRICLRRKNVCISLVFAVNSSFFSLISFCAILLLLMKWQTFHGCTEPLLFNVRRNGPFAVASMQVEHSNHGSEVTPLLIHFVFTDVFSPILAPPTNAHFLDSFRSLRSCLLPIRLCDRLARPGAGEGLNSTRTLHSTDRSDALFAFID